MGRGESAVTISVASDPTGTAVDPVDYLSRKPDGQCRTVIRGESGMSGAGDIVSSEAGRTPQTKAPDLRPNGSRT